MCKCLENLNKNMLDYLTKQHAEMGHKVLPIDSLSDDGVDNVHFILPSKEDTEKFDCTGMQLHTRFAYRYTFEKKDKTISKPRREGISIAFTFCPLCGEPYKKPKTNKV
jgi:hypothetical protein